MEELQNPERGPEDVAKPRQGSAVWLQRPEVIQAVSRVIGQREEAADSTMLGCKSPSWEDCSDPYPWGKVSAGTHCQGEEWSWSWPCQKPGHRGRI